jgi:hypothetical protein
VQGASAEAIVRRAVEVVARHCSRGFVERRRRR